jgi:hypothetical protein
MARAELEQALSAEGAHIVSSERKAIHASLADGKEVTVIYGNDDQTKEIDITATAPNDNLYPALEHRFWQPQQVDEEGKSPCSTFWSGENNVQRMPNIVLKIVSLEDVPSFTRRLRLIDLLIDDHQRK